MSKSKTLISLYWPDKFIHNFSEISSKSKSDLRWLWKIQATLVVTRQQTDFLGSENIKSRIFVKHRSMRCLKMVSSPRKLKNQYMNFKTMHNVYILLYFNVSRVIRQVQRTLCMKISQFQSKPDPIRFDLTMNSPSISPPGAEIFDIHRWVVPMTSLWLALSLD